MACAEVMVQFNVRLDSGSVFHSSSEGYFREPEVVLL